MIGSRVGIGYDIHPFAPPEAGRPLVLGGVTIPHPRGLAGHSDADVVLHAVCDAILGAIGCGDLGGRFPDTDPGNEGASSVEFLRAAAATMSGRGFKVCNLDVVVVAEEPKIAPHVPAMKDLIARALGAPEDRISIKAKRPERLGALGRGEGIACESVILLGHRGAIARLRALLRRG